MTKRRNWKVIPLLIALALTVSKAADSAYGQGMAPTRGLTSFTDSSRRNVIIIGFVGGFVSRDDAKHPEVEFAAYLRDRYPFAHAEVFGNHHGQRALHF